MHADIVDLQQPSRRLGNSKGCFACPRLGAGSMWECQSLGHRARRVAAHAADTALPLSLHQLEVGLGPVRPAGSGTGIFVTLSMSEIVPWHVRKIPFLMR